MTRADISEIAPRFPALRIAFVVADGIRPAPGSSPALRQRMRDTEQALQSRYTLDGVAQVPGIKVWREAYKAFGVKKTSYRSSVERLLRRVLQGRGLPSVSPFVDAYNEVSARFLLPLGADDLDLVEGDLFFRVGRPDDSFVPLGGGEEGETEPPKPGEIVYADSAKILCRRWNWYQDARSPVTADTTRAVLTVQCLGAGDLDAAVAAVCAALHEECGARTAVAIASAMDPVVALPV
jgi:DNA/RNA-binding domain of Phe-tRNA-synthetase-like protein